VRASFSPRELFRACPVALHELRSAALAASAATAANSVCLSVPPLHSHLLWIQPLFVVLAIGEPLALKKSMLRITLPTADGSGVFVLEGRLAGLWAQELFRVAREANERRENTFDLREVTYVDSTGENVLRMLSRSGARFITESAYGKDLCRRLKLDRIKASEVQSRRPKPQSDADSGNGHRPDTARCELLSADTLPEQRPGYGK